MRDFLLDRPTLERLERLAIHWRRSFQGLVGGHNRSRLQGYGQEFLDHRNFYPGDDLRAVNWRAYLRFERFLLKTFELEPRIPIRLLLDVSASMATPGMRDEPSKFDYARQLALALVYVGLVNLDTVIIQPFSNTLLPPHFATGGRQRIHETEVYLQGVKSQGTTSFTAVTGSFLRAHPKPGLLIAISDFFADEDILPPLQRVTDAGHELLLVQVWSSCDRSPQWNGALELTEVESGRRQTLQVDDVARQTYIRRINEYSDTLKQLALRNKGRFVDLSTRVPIEQALFGPVQSAIGQGAIGRI